MCVIVYHLLIVGILPTLDAVHHDYFMVLNIYTNKLIQPFELVGVPPFWAPTQQWPALDVVHFDTVTIVAIIQ